MLLLWTLSTGLALQAPERISQSAAGQPQHREVTYADVRASLALGCSDGNQGFCYELAKMLLKGLGGPAEPDRARSLLTRACTEGFVRACAAQPR
jgi:TPR repeat protein